jgi:phage shock protein C
MKKLTRSKTDKKVSGVCAGIADYFELDPTLIRAIAVLLIIFSGFLPGLIAYIVLAIIIPEQN